MYHLVLLLPWYRDSGWTSASNRWIFRIRVAIPKHIVVRWEENQKFSFTKQLWTKSASRKQWLWKRAQQGSKCFFKSPCTISYTWKRLTNVRHLVNNTVSQANYPFAHLAWPPIQASDGGTANANAWMTLTCPSQSRLSWCIQKKNWRKHKSHSLVVIFSNSSCARYDWSPCGRSDVAGAFTSPKSVSNAYDFHEVEAKLAARSFRNGLSTVDATGDGG